MCFSHCVKLPFPTCQQRLCSLFVHTHSVVSYLKTSQDKWRWSTQVSHLIVAYRKDCWFFVAFFFPVVLLQTWKSEVVTWFSVINGNSFNVGAVLLSSRHTFMYCLARQEVLKGMPSAEFITYVLRGLSKSDSAPADVDVASSCVGHTGLALASRSDRFRGLGAATEESVRLWTK